MHTINKFFTWTILISLIALLITITACSSASTPASTSPTTPSPTTASSPSMTMPPTTTTPARSPSSPIASTPAPTGPAVTIDLTAQNIAFDKSTITVPVSAQVTLNFNNKDNGIQHNFALYTDSSASDSIFVGNVITGPGTTTYRFSAPAKPGTYYFQCDIHPTLMNGSFIVQ